MDLKSAQRGWTYVRVASSTSIFKVANDVTAPRMQFSWLICIYHGSSIVFDMLKCVLAVWIRLSCCHLRKGIFTFVSTQRHSWIVWLANPTRVSRLAAVCFEIPQTVQIGYRLLKHKTCIVHDRQLQSTFGDMERARIYAPTQFRQAPPLNLGSELHAQKSSSSTKSQNLMYLALHLHLRSKVAVCIQKSKRNVDEKGIRTPALSDQRIGRTLSWRLRPLGHLTIWRGWGCWETKGEQIL